jgi:hypothetical protein
MSTDFSFALYWAAALTCVVAQGLVIRSLLLGRTPGARRTAWARAREVAWVLLPAVMLAAVLVSTWRAVRDAPNDHGPAAVSGVLAGQGGAA